MQSRASRVARGWLAGSFATVVAFVSHSLAAGAPPSGFAIVNALVFAGLLGTFTVGRRPSLPRLAVIVIGSQFAFHLVFTWLTPGVAVADETAGGAHHSVAALLPASATADQAASAMWLAHAVAAVATIVFLRYVELALWSLVREVLEAVLRVMPTQPTPMRPGGSGVVCGGPRYPVSFLFLSTLVRRGPPLLSGT